jgi:hypothetical protein
MGQYDSCEFPLLNTIVPICNKLLLQLLTTLTTVESD